MKVGSSPTYASPGCGAGDLLQIVFIVLKLCHVIDWPWPVVLTPLWIGLALLTIVIVAIVITAAVVNSD